MIKRTFTQDKGIYGRQEREGFATSETSGFVVFREETRGWALAQVRSGLSVMALVPRAAPKTKRGLLAFVEAMEAANEDACAIVGALDTLPWPEEAKPFGRQLIDWARDYTP